MMPHPTRPRPPARATDTALLRPVEAALAAARQRAADRQARQTEAPAPATAPAPGDRQLRCPACGRVELRSADQLRRLVRAGWPECCGRAMPPATAAGPDRLAPAPAAAPEPAEGPQRPRPLWTRAGVRRGLLGIGPDLAVELLDLTAGGVRIRLTEPVARREEVDVALGPAGGGRAVRLPAAADSCQEAGDGSFVAEFRFRRPLSAESLADLAGERPRSGPTSASR